ncbi:MAG: peptidase S8/S53 subtilisin kexin sedolisin [Alphaproteobacteria bacterium HGW-Alphaproteobacteria-18]|nr:MAG: peptidase S8/S53 subtilisin kexin sedolisin [Alphaproteobacteria bacterium HGW-Alphaproteobacteria-18]
MQEEDWTGRPPSHNLNTALTYGAGAFIGIRKGISGMLKLYTTRTARAAIALALGGAALLAACDQIETRIDRAREIADASVDQINGETVIDPTYRNLERASPADRALAGTVMAEFVIDEDDRPMFAIGSIIAKPLAIPEVAPIEIIGDAELMEEELAYFDSPAGEAMLEVEEAPAGAPAPLPVAPLTTREPASAFLEVQPAQVMPRITLDPRANQESREEIAQAGRKFDQVAIQDDTKRLQMRSLSKEDLQAMAPEERAETRKLARRAPVEREVVRKQLDANTVMLDTMTRYGVGGEVSLSRQGQMVIQIGADGANPTQFRGRNGPEEFLARADTSECPEDADAASVSADLAMATACVVRDLRASGQFEYVEQDFIFQNQFARKPRDMPAGTPGETKPGGSTGSSGSTGAKPAVFDPNDPLWALQWHFRDKGSSDGRTAGGAGFESFWKKQGITGSNGIVVAVVDTGLQMNHPDIAGSPNIMPGYDMVSDPRMGNDGDGRDSDPNDPGDMCDPTKPGASDSFHGTHVAGTIGAAATNNGAGVAGGAWDVRIVPVRALGKCGGRLSDINDAIRWAAGLIPAEVDEGPQGWSEVWNEHPADIINLSIGLLGACPASLQDAINAATAEGVIVVSAAGNARMSTSFYAPAGCQNVVTVAASDARGQIAPYSNFGPEVMVLAPGGDLTRDDNGDGKPDGVLSTKAATNCYDPVTGDGVANCFYAYEQGTSMAAPHVSAALALLKARDPSARREDIISTLRASLDPRESLQCAGLCSQYPGASPIEGSADMCARPCGEGLLNLANVPLKATGGGGR